MVTWERARLEIQSIDRDECLESWHKSALIDYNNDEDKIPIYSENDNDGEPEDTPKDDPFPTFLEEMWLTTHEASRALTRPRLLLRPQELVSYDPVRPQLVELSRKS
jgi:hypothetical protein